MSQVCFVPLDVDKLHVIIIDILKPHGIVTDKLHHF